MSTLSSTGDNGHNERTEATFTVKSGLAEMLKGGVIMDVVTPEQARIAEDAGAAAVMALERVPADIRRDGGVARMSDPEMIKGIQEAVTIPVMAKARIGHFAEAQVLEALEVDYIDESEVLTPADEANHIDKWAFRIPFVCGATNLGEALRRIGEGAAMIRSKGEAGTGDIVEAVRHLRKIRSEMRRLTTLDPEELPTAAKELQSPLPLVRQIAEAGRLPVVVFCAGGIATPADASLVMQLGAEGVFGDLQVRGSRAPRPRNRRGHHALQGPGPRRDGQYRARSRDGQPRDLQAGVRAAALATRLVVALTVGVLALQGDFEAHSKILKALGTIPREVRVPADLKGIDALVLPGGESTVMTLGIEREKLGEPLRALAAAGTPILGTCAGMIILDRAHLGVLDILARRNAFGRQLRSFEANLEIEGVSEPPARPVHAVFIRAPWVQETGPDVRVLADVDGHPVAVRQGNVVAISFHPELSGERRLHELVLALAQPESDLGLGGARHRAAD
jgi:pyridoxal 5'-phosphate synthase pdxS subunit